MYINLLNKYINTYRNLFNIHSNYIFNIIVVGNGNIIESGNHDKLIGLNGVYKQLWDIQTGKINK